MQLLLQLDGLRLVLPHDVPNGEVRQLVVLRQLAAEVGLPWGEVAVQAGAAVREIGTMEKEGKDGIRPGDKSSLKVLGPDCFTSWSQKATCTRTPEKHSVRSFVAENF